MKVCVDKGLCLGCGICVEICPEVFEMDDEDKAQAKVALVPSESGDSCHDAADQCPGSAITIEED